MGESFSWVFSFSPSVTSRILMLLISHLFVAYVLEI